MKEQEQDSASGFAVAGLFLFIGGLGAVIFYLSGNFFMTGGSLAILIGISLLSAWRSSTTKELSVLRQDNRALQKGLSERGYTVGRGINGGLVIRRA